MFGWLNEGPNGQYERYTGLTAIDSWPSSTNAGSQHCGVHSTIRRDGQETQKKILARLPGVEFARRPFLAPVVPGAIGLPVRVEENLHRRPGAQRSESGHR